MVETRREKQKNMRISLQDAIDRLRHSSSSPSPPVSNKKAAVLVPLFETHDGHIHVILTQRSAKLNSYPGEVCFPGGKRDKQDEDDIATALREAHEELNIPPASVNVVTTLAPVLSKNYLSVTPVIGIVSESLQFRKNPAEVEEVFTAPLSMFLEAGQEYSCRDVQWESFPYRLHYWKYLYREKEFLIWGLTAGLLIVVAEKVFGRKPGFRLNPPGTSIPFSALAYENGRLVFRGRDAIEGNIAGTAAVEGAVVMSEEAAAALGEAEDADEKDI